MGVLAGFLVGHPARFRLDGFVHKNLETVELMQTKIMMKLWVKTFSEPSLLLGIYGYFFLGHNVRGV